MYCDRSRLYLRYWVKAKRKTCHFSLAHTLFNAYSRATALSLAKRGPKVIYVTDLTLTNLDELVKEIETTYTGVRCIARAVDAASTNDVTAVIDEAMKEFGRLDVFVANAGIATGSRIHEEDAESFMKMMRVNALRYKQVVVLLYTEL